MEHHQVYISFSKITEEYMLIRNNIAITWPKYKYTGGIIKVIQLVLWEKYVWLLNKG